jgi:hypothetical protein
MSWNCSLAFVTAVGLACGASAMSAHHGDAGRYEETLTTVTGTLAELQLVTPHSILSLDVRESDGRMVRWRGELGSAQVMRRWCWTADTFKKGDTLTMTGRRLKNGTPYMTLSEGARVLDASNKEWFRGNDPGQLPGAAVPPPCAS